VHETSRTLQSLILMNSMCFICTRKKKLGQHKSNVHNRVTGLQTVSGGCSHRPVTLSTLGQRESTIDTLRKTSPALANPLQSPPQSPPASTVP